MRKSLKMMGCIAVTGLMLVVACKKKTDEVADAKKNLVGVWRFTDEVVDSNRNGIKDPNEYYNLDSLDTETITFKADGTGDIEQIPLTWTMIDANRFKFSYVNSRGEPDTLDATIISSSRFDITVPPQSTDLNAWLVFKKK